LCPIEFLRIIFDQKHGREIAAKLGITPEPGGGHEKVIFRYRDKEIARYNIRRSSKSCPHNFIASQLHLTTKQCKEFHECSMSVDDYLKILKEKGKIADDSP